MENLNSMFCFQCEQTAGCSGCTKSVGVCGNCLLYTSDAADELDGVDLGGRRIIKKKFFQAEDGIRDQPRSRGLGDVYKRQIYTRGTFGLRSE